MALGNWGPVLLVTGGRLSSLNSSGLAGEKGRKKGGGEGWGSYSHTQAR